MTRVLVVEDDRFVGSFLEKGLRSAGYSVDLVDDAETARWLVTHAAFDLVVLDVGLPDDDGLVILKDLRAAGSEVPVLVLTGLVERDVVTCLEAGADDYMCKPFRFEELLARLRTRLRHSPGESSRHLQVGSLRLDLLTRRASHGNAAVELTGREFSLLETFLRHPDQVLTRQQLLSQVWGLDFDPGTNLVNVYVNVLRNKLGRDVIETVRGSGYRVRSR